MYGEPMSTVAHARGVIAGAAILTFFGAVWCILALALWPAHPRWSIPAGSAVAIVLIALCLQRLIAWRKIPSIDDPIAAAKGKRAGMWFGIIFGIEGLLIGLTAALLSHLGLSDWIPIAAAVIIGLHFLPFARLFEVPLYYWTGAFSILGPIACCAISDPALRTLYASLIMAAVLWLTSVLLLVKTHPTQPA
jgi:hypothetical protein